MSPLMRSRSKLQRPGEEQRRSISVVTRQKTSLKTLERVLYPSLSRTNQSCVDSWQVKVVTTNSYWLNYGR